MTGDRVEQILSGLRARGGRVTASRRALLDCLVAARGQLTADEIATQVQRTLPDVSPSTIYRALNDLQEAGVVAHVHLGHGPATYRLVDEPVIHLRCEECGVIVEIPDEAISGLRRELLASHGFELVPLHFAFAGRCARCRGKRVGTT